MVPANQIEAVGHQTRSRAPSTKSPCAASGTAPTPTAAATALSEWLPGSTSTRGAPSLAPWMLVGDSTARKGATPKQPRLRQRKGTANREEAIRGSRQRHARGRDWFGGLSITHSGRSVLREHPRARRAPLAPIGAHRRPQSPRAVQKCTTNRRTVGRELVRQMKRRLARDVRASVGRLNVLVGRRRLVLSVRSSSSSPLLLRRRPS